jgi:hypothetical protein
MNKRKNPGKGGAFERLMAKTFSLWLTGGEDRKQLIRSVLSGGWVERDLLQLGDLAPNGPEGLRFRKYFVVECKHRKEILFWHFFTQSPGENIAGWWVKLWEEIEEVNLPQPPAPLLVFRMNHRPVMVATSPHLISRPDQWTMELHPYPRWPMTLLPLDDFLKLPPEVYYERAGGLHG